MDYAVFIGRFQPVHIGHMQVVKRALERHDRVIIGIGSANLGRRTSNPFTYEERVKFWTKAMYYPHNGIDSKRVSFCPIDDMTYSDAEWAASVRHRVTETANDPDATFILTGHNKDHTSNYLGFFPEWDSDLLPAGFDTFASTRIREFFYKRLGQSCPWLEPDQFYGNRDLVGLGSPSIIWDRENQAILRELAPEWDFDQNYDPKKFDVNVVTVDAVVVMNGHVLVVERKNRPGMGLLACPGGHINLHETLEDAMLRELREETGIDRSDRVLRSNIKTSRVFDDPGRSKRARVITNAYLIHLPNEDSLPKVKGSDDAARAFWMPLSEVKPADFFEDHSFMILRLTAGM